MASAPSLYAVLGLEKDANADQIKKAYRTAALAHHPDRNINDPSAKDRFQQIQKANEILSDPAKRAAYDIGGERGVAAMDNEFAGAFGQQIGGPGLIFIALVMAAAFFLSMLFTLAGVAAKLDAANDFSWTHSLFGAWFLDVFMGVLCIVHVFAFVSACRDKNLAGALIMLVTLFVTGLFVVWTVFVGMNLDGKLQSDGSKWPWIGANSPGIAAGGTLFATSCVLLYHSIGAEAEAFEMNCFVTALVVLSRLLIAATPMTQLILISLKADLTLGAEVSWFVVLLPAFLFSLLRGFSSCINSLLMALRGVDQWNGILCREVFGWAFSHLLYLVGVGLVAEKLQDPAGTSRSWGVTLVPWFIMVGVGVLLLCCLMCHFALLMSVMQMEEAHAQQQQQQPQQPGGQQQQQQQPSAAGAASTPYSSDAGTGRAAAASGGGGGHRAADDSDGGDANSDTPIIVGYGTRE